MTTDLAQRDCLFPTDNDLEIPTLSLDVQPKLVEIPFVCFGEQKRTFNMGGNGTLHFYTDDYRFSAVFDHPDRITQHHPANIVEPNYSLFNETPIAMGMQGVYKKRFVARMMQQCGIGVFVDLNVAPKFYKLNLLGVPLGYSAFCTRGYSDRLNGLEFEYEMAKMVANGNPLTFVVYGGGAAVKAFCKERGLVYVTPVIAIKNKAKSFEKMKESIAFFGQSIALDAPKKPTLAELLERQVEDFGKAKQLEENNQ